MEPLSVGPDLHPIQEEPTPRESLAGSGESHRSAPPSGAGDADRPLPVKVRQDGLLACAGSSVKFHLLFCSGSLVSMADFSYNLFRIFPTLSESALLITFHGFSIWLREIFHKLQP